VSLGANAGNEKLYVGEKFILLRKIDPFKDFCNPHFGFFQSKLYSFSKYIAQRMVLKNNVVQQYSS
jgi:hypothetical protein